MMFLNLLLFLLFERILAAEYRVIHDASELIELSNEVNSRTTYERITAYLVNDIEFNDDFSQQFNPIGNDTSKYFIGTFDGQGHVISNLKINSSSQYVGLFGSSNGLLLKNVVIDSSCSVISSYEGSSYAYVGGIIGDCFATSYGLSIIESSVNMANVTSIGKSGLYLGGMAGYLGVNGPSSYNCTIKNCANYGTVTHSGSRGYIGGIAGYFYLSSYVCNYIQNCINYGSIIHEGTSSSSLYLGGIAGYSYYGRIENCVSSGKITISSVKRYRGSVVGYVYSNTYIIHCYYTNDVGVNNLYGTGSPTLTDTPTSSTDIDSSLINNLNTQTTSNSWNKWVLNPNNKTVTFKINNNTGFSVSSQVILLPDLIGDEHYAFRWYKDSDYESLFSDFEVMNDIYLHGKLEKDTNNYTITFNTRGGPLIEPIITQCGIIVSLPNSLNGTNCDFVRWETEDGDNIGFSFTMPGHNTTLYAVWMCNLIATFEDFFSFLNSVNSGMTYESKTVSLGSDLSFFDYSSLNPIGISSSYQFRGTFDGQGHVINDLTISSSSQYVGLFGYSTGLTIKNVVMDGSCSLESSSSISGPGGSSYVGGIIGYCKSEYNQCNIENNVNMANVTFVGKKFGDISLGGIVGSLYSPSSIYCCIVKNCVNYGTVTHSGSGNYLYIGGIIGYSNGQSSNPNLVQNCLNYGTINHNEEITNRLSIGGIAGYSNYVKTENCVSGGKITISDRSVIPSDNYQGSVVGYVNSNTYIIHCYYTSEVGINDLYVINSYSTSPTLTDTPTSSTDVDSSLINNLNAQATNNGWNKWVLNPNNKTATFKINNNTEFSVSSQVILLSDLIGDEKYAFKGWYNDSSYLASFTFESITEHTLLYGIYNIKVTITFNDNASSGISPSTKNVVQGYFYGALATPIREGYSFAGWHTENNEFIDNKTIVNTSVDHTLYAHWTANEYTVTFNVNGGNELIEIEKKNITVTFDSIYGYLPTPSRVGYTFNGWHTEPSGGIAITTNSTMITTADLTLYAQWVANTYNVTLDFGNGDSSLLFKEITYNTTYGDLPTSSKVGYTFVGWFTEIIEGTPVNSSTTVLNAFNHTLYAHWTANRYTVFFNANSGSVPTSSITVTFDSIYGDLPTPIRSGYTFVGWLDENNRCITNETIVNISDAHTLHAEWDKEEKSSSSTSLVVGTVVPICIIVIAGVALALFILFKRKSSDDTDKRIRLDNLSRENYSRFVGTSQDEGKIAKNNTESILANLYPQGYARPSMMDALFKAELSKESAELICNACSNVARNTANKQLPEEFTTDDAAAVAMYTYDFGGEDFENNPYRIINKSLVGRNYASLQKASGVLYLVMTALRKLPRVTGRILYRGVRGEMNLNESHYCEGNIVTWVALSSTSPDMKATKSFLAKSSRSKKATGTLFIIENGWGYNIQPFSLFPDEEEILIEPERQFKVTGVIQTDGMTIINLQMLDTPLSIPEVFGEGRL